MEYCERRPSRTTFELHGQARIAIFIYSTPVGGGVFMGTIVFLVLRLAFGFNTYGDAQVLATLVSLDSIAVTLFFRLKRKS